MRVAINRLDVWPGDGRVISYLKSLTGLTAAAVRGGGAAGSDCSSHGVHWNLFCGPVRRPAAARQGKLPVPHPALRPGKGWQCEISVNCAAQRSAVCPVCRHLCSYASQKPDQCCCRLAENAYTSVLYNISQAS